MDLNTPLNPVEQRLVAKADIAKIPISAAFELTPVCNLDCDMCFIHTAKHQVDKQGGLLSADDWINYALQLKERSEERRVGKECTYWCRSRW